MYSDANENAESVGTLRDAMLAIQEHGRLTGMYYPLAQRVVAFLLETRGLGTVHRMCSKPLGSEEELEVALLDELGLSIDQFQAELDAYPPWSVAQLRQDQACEGADAVVSQAAWTIELGCSAPGVEGRLGGEVSSHVLVEIAEFGQYAFDFNTSEPLQNLKVELRGCERDGLASIYYTTWIGSTGESNHLAPIFNDLTPGVYVLRFRLKDSSSLGPDVQIALSVAQWP
ncbi:hypothetical protein [Enhygromyxa salina]|uniref:hypothetical protein n=1 Tax=Enhygromyxa salina TaxID=215803 RepID=UPI0011B294C6|nr:hypothetical protein [Enhygromyxa salina]